MGWELAGRRGWSVSMAPASSPPASSGPTRHWASRSEPRTGRGRSPGTACCISLAGGVGFTSLAVACFVIARRYSTENRRGWAVFSRLTGVVFLAGFAMVASSGGNQAANLAFTAAIILVWAWTTAVALDRYRRVAHHELPINR